MNDHYSLKGKAAIVTGAGGGICRAISITFAQAGAKVACLDVKLKNAEETARLAGDSALAIACDVSSESDTKAAVERAAKTFGRLD
ncbi:MAG: SDR family NAD(P)-dependent oxidoreductase, partial [Burkholderiales bacterium]